MRHISTPVDEASALLSHAITYEKQHLITVTISSALNDAPWTIEEIAPRVGRFFDSKTFVEMWTLDGEPLIEIWPFELTPQRDDGSANWMINASFGYFVYPQTGGSS